MKIALNMIVKDEVEEVSRLIDRAQHFFDGIFITVSDQQAHQKLKKLQNDKVKIDFRVWNNKFDDARNHNWNLAEGYDASFWLDADDSFNFGEIPRLKSLLKDYDVVFLPYHYESDDNGNVIVSHWRERLVKRDKGFSWKGWVHETLITDEHFKKINVDIPIVHITGSDHKNQSQERNHAILLEAYQATKDPRYLHYLGLSFFNMFEYEKAIETLRKYCEVGGWDEEVYRSLIKMGQCAFMLGRNDEAIDYELKAIALMPELPMAYEMLAHFEYTANNYKQALEWVKMAVRKDTPEGASIFDPTAKDRTILTGAMCEYHLGNYRDAAELIKQVKTIDTSDVIGEFEHEASIERLEGILPALFKHYENPAVLWEGLHEDIKFRPEFRVFREQFTEPKTWKRDSIVFFCGKGYEEWGPKTLKKGMGGSEEAIVYLTRELDKLGRQVTVYGAVEKPYKDGNVDWLPWNYIDKRDKFDTLVVWRYPQFTTQFTANKMFVDMHDLLPEEMVKPYENVTYLFKSQWHKDQYPNIKNFNVIPNGIKVSQFKSAKKKPYSIIYPSAYYRGLECLLQNWHKIKEQVPKATLDVYYGWQSWVTAEGEDDFYHRMLHKFDTLKDQGVTEHGRIDHETLAKKFAEAKVWAYPTEFPEIFCITAVKANLAGCKNVITDVAALTETGGPQATYIETDTIYSDQYKQEKFVEAVVKALKEDHNPTEQMQWAKQFDWSKVCGQWIEAIK